MNERIIITKATAKTAAVEVFSINADLTKPATNNATPDLPEDGLQTVKVNAANFHRRARAKARCCHNAVAPTGTNNGACAWLCERVMVTAAESNARRVSATTTPAGHAPNIKCFMDIPRFDLLTGFYPKFQHHACTWWLSTATKSHLKGIFKFWTL